MLDILGPDGSTLFEIIDRIGAGGLGTVFRVRCVQAGGAMAAVKVAHLSPEDGPGFHERFLEEVRNAGPILHRHLVRIRDAGVINSEAAYVLTDFVDGPNLTDYVREHGPMNPRRVAGLAGQVLKGLQASHDHRYIHRNLTPNNVLLRSSHHATVEVVLTDLGLSRCAYPNRDPEPGRHVFVTTGGLRFVDPRYSAPECNDLDRWDVTADLFSVGLIIHWMLAGELPFDDETEYRRWLEAEGTLERSLPVRSDIPDSWQPLLRRSLAVRPEDRFPGVAQMLAEVNRLRESPGRLETLRSRLGLGKPQVMKRPAPTAVPPRASILDAPPDTKARMVAETKLQIPSAPEPRAATPVSAPRTPQAPAEPTRAGGATGAGTGEAPPAVPSPAPDQGETILAAPTPISGYGDDFATTPVPMETPVPLAPMRVPGAPTTPPKKALPWRMIAVGAFILIMVVAGIRLGRGLIPAGGDPDAKGPPPAAPPGMVYVPPVKAGLGSAEPKGGVLSTYEVNVAGFFLDLTEVTAGAYHDAFANNPDRWPPAWKGKAPEGEARELPVSGVTLEDAQAFAAAAGKRLPTADEWERAARSGGSMFPWGGRYDPSLEGRTAPSAVTETGIDRTTEGVFGMAGNVSEWTATPFRKTGGLFKKHEDVPGRFTIKGGNFRHMSEAAAQACAQSGQPADFRDPGLGFRCAKDAAPGGD